MAKLSIPNRPGKYELDGFDIHIFPNEIIIYTHRRERSPEASEHAARIPSMASVAEEPTASILDSVSILAKRFGGKK